MENALATTTIWLYYLKEEFPCSFAWRSEYYTMLTKYHEDDFVWVANTIIYIRTFSIRSTFDRAAGVWIEIKCDMKKGAGVILE